MGTYERHEAQRAVVAKHLEHLTTEIQRLDDVELRQRLTLTANLLHEQLAGNVRRLPTFRRRSLWPTTAECYRGASDDGSEPKGAA